MSLNYSTVRFAILGIFAWLSALASASTLVQLLVKIANRQASASMMWTFFFVVLSLGAFLLFYISRKSIQSGLVKVTILLSVILHLAISMLWFSAKSPNQYFVLLSSILLVGQIYAFISIKLGRTPA